MGRLKHRSCGWDGLSGKVADLRRAANGRSSTAVQGHSRRRTRPQSRDPMPRVDRQDIALSTGDEVKAQLLDSRSSIAFASRELMPTVA